VNLIKAHKGQFSFQLNDKEKRSLLKVLELYPLVPSSYQKLSRSPARPEDQQLLDEALATQRRQNQRELLALIQAKNRFQANAAGFRLTLKQSHLDWLLQVLNDIRVGSWLQLGSPGDLAETFGRLNEKTAPFLWSMEVAGHFQMSLIHETAGVIQATDENSPEEE
jgi:hypothetical protein